MRPLNPWLWLFASALAGCGLPSEERCSQGLCHPAPDGLSACAGGCPQSFTCNAQAQCAGGDLENLQLNVQEKPWGTVAVSGRVRLNGQLPSRDAAYCGKLPSEPMATVTFAEVHQGKRYEAYVPCAAADFAFSLALPPGTYEVRVGPGYRPTASGVNLPVVPSVVVRELVVAAPLEDLSLNVEAHPVEGRLTLNGQPPTKDVSYCDAPANRARTIAAVEFREATTGAVGALSIPCASPDYAFSAMLPGGAYEVSLKRGSYADSAGVNLLPGTYPMSATLAVQGPLKHLVLDQVGFPVSGRITLDGAIPTRDDSYCAGRPGHELAVVQLQDAARPYQLELPVRCSATAFEFSGWVPPGTYRVSVARGRYSDEAKVNLLDGAVRVEPALSVTGPRSELVLNTSSHLVSGKITVGGKVPTKNPAHCLTGTSPIAAVHFHQEPSGFTTQVPIRCDTTDFSFSARLPPGRYRVQVEALAAGVQAGLNLAPGRWTWKTELELHAPSVELAIDQVNHPVRGRLTLNGAPPERRGDYCAQANNRNRPVVEVRFADRQQGYSGQLLLPCSATTDFEFAAFLPAGTYEVSVGPSTFFDAANLTLMDVHYPVRSQVRVSGPVESLVLDQVGRPIRGRVLVGGQPPTRNQPYCTANPNQAIATVQFFDERQNYLSEATIECAAEGFQFDAVLPSGVYQAKVLATSYSALAEVNLPSASATAVERLVVP